MSTDLKPAGPAPKPAERRFIIPRDPALQTPLPEDHLSTKLPLADQIPQSEDLIIKYFQQEYNNRVLHSQLVRQESAQASQATSPIPDLLVQTAGSVDLNFNNKNNYVNFLHEKIVELHRLRLKDGSLFLHQDFTKLKAEFENTKGEYNTLLKRHADLKRQNLETRKQLDTVDLLRDQGKEMRRALLLYHYTNSVPKELIATFDLERHNPLFDDDEITGMIKQLKSQQENRGRSTLTGPNSKDLEMAVIMQQKNRNILELQNQIRALYVEQDRMKEQLKVRGVSPKRVEAQLSGLKSQMNELMNAQAEESRNRIEELSKKLKTAETQKIKEGMKMSQLKRDFAAQVKELEGKVATLTGERNRFKTDFESADARAKKFEDRLQRAQAEQKAFYNRMMTQANATPATAAKAMTLRFLEEAKKKLAEVAAGGQASVEVTMDILQAIEVEFKVTDDLTQKLVMMTEAKDGLSVEAKRLASDLEELGKSVRDLQKQLLATQDQLSAKVQEEADLKRQVGILNDSVADEKARADILKRQVGDLEMSIEDKKQEILAAKEETKERETTIEELKKTIEGLEAKISELNGTIASRDKEIQDQEQKVQEEKDKFANYLAEQKAQLDRIMNGSKAETMNDVYQLNSIILRMKPILDEALRENADAKQNLVDFKQTKETLVKKMEEISKMMEEKAAVDEDLANTKADLDETEAALAEAQKQIEGLKKSGGEAEERATASAAMVATLQARVSQYLDQQREWQRELEELRKYKEVNEEAFGGSVDLVELRARSYELSQKAKKFEDLNETLLADNTKLKGQVEKFAETVESMTALKIDQTRSLKEAQEIAELKTQERDAAKRELKEAQEKIANLTDQLKEERDEFEKIQKEVVALRDKLFDLTKLDPRLNVQTRAYETEIQSLVLANEQLQNQLSKQKALQKLTEKDLAAKKEELAILRALDVGVLEAKLAEKDFQIIEMVKMTNEQQLALEEAVSRREKTDQTNTQLAQRVHLLQETLRTLKDNKRLIEDTSSAFLVNLRNEFGVSKEDENTVNELKILYKKLEELRDQLALWTMSGNADVTKHPVVQRKLIELDTKEKELKIRAESAVAFEKKAERIMDDLKKTEEELRQTKTQLEAQRDLSSASMAKISELEFSLEQIRSIPTALREELRAKEQRLEILSGENSDLSELVRTQGVQLSTVRAELSIAQQRATASAKSEKEIREELQTLQLENIDLQEAIISNTENFLNKLNELQDNLDESEAQKGKGAAKIEALEAEVGVLTNKLEGETAKSDALNYRLDYMTKLNEKYSRLLKLPADFAEKLTNYDDFIERFNELQEENVLKQKQIESLEAQLDEVYRRNPRLQKEISGFDEAADSSLVSIDVKPAGIDPNRHHFMTTNERPSLMRQPSTDATERRAVDLARRLEILEAENKSLRQNLNAYVAKTKNMSENSGIRIKDFMTSTIINQDDLKAELAARNRKIESLHQNAARILEDYRSVKETLDKTQARLKRRTEEYRKSDLERANLLSENQKLKEQLSLQGILKESDISAANLAVIRMLQDKEAAHKQVMAILQDNIERLAGDKAEAGDADQVIRRLQLELKESREAVEKLEMKYETAAASSKAAAAQLEAQRLILVKTQKDLEEALATIEAEREKLRVAEEEASTQAMMQKTLQNLLDSANDQLDSQKAANEALREELALQREYEDEDDVDKNERLFQKLDQKEKEIHRLKSMLKEHGECTVTIQDQKRSLADNETELKALRLEKARLDSEVTSLDADRQKYQDEARANERRLVLLKDEVQVLGANLQKQTESAAILQKNNSSLREKIRDLVISFGTKNAEHKEIIDALLAEATGLKNALIRVVHRSKPNAPVPIAEETETEGEQPAEENAN